MFPLRVRDSYKWNQHATEIYMVSMYLQIKIKSSQKGSTRRLFSSTRNDEETRKFDALASEWWDTRGSLRLLHLMNPLRIEYIRIGIQKYYHDHKLKIVKNNVFENLNILDVGCGAGILSEPLARLNANVEGIDAAEYNIHSACRHRDEDPSLLNKHLIYSYGTPKDLLESKRRCFDIVLAMEIIEHVDHPEIFISELSELMKPNGLLFLSTINRTTVANILTIKIAEDVMGWVKPGTHSYDKYKTPDEMKTMLSKYGLDVCDIQGITYSPFHKNWFFIPFTCVNYMMVLKKR